jgi:hypothetical protein
MDGSESSRVSVISELDDAHTEMSSAQSRLLAAIARCDRNDVWEPDGFYSYAQWVSSRLHISRWAAGRLINAAHALPNLPETSAALASGGLGLDKVVELCRFATPETESKLIRWAQGVLPATVRERADLTKRRALSEVVEADRDRSLRWWWYDVDGHRMGIEGILPAEQGVKVIKALDRMAGKLPDIIEDDDQVVDTHGSLEARRADALVALCSARIAEDHDPDRATVVVHAPLATLVGAKDTGCGVEGDGILHPETVRRLSCDCRLEVALEDADGFVVGIGRASRTPPPWLRRALLHRDRGCQFPGCGARRFLHCHHIWHWIRGGPTELGNLVLVCSFHHKLVHEHGWNVELGDPGTSRWYRPGGRRYMLGPEQTDRPPPGIAEIHAA